MALCAFYLYLAFHALSGSQGVMRWVDYEADIERNQAKLEAVQQQRMDMERQANALRASQLNLDVLDQRSREILHASHPKDYTIWLDETP